MLSLKTPISQLVGVGPKMNLALFRLGVETIEDLLYYFPRRFDDFSRPTEISRVIAGENNIISGRIIEIENERTPRRRINITRVLVADESGQIPVIFFNQPFLTRIFKIGTSWIFLGKVERMYGAGLQMSCVIYEKEGKILPVYPLTLGIGSKFLRRLIKPLVEQNLLDDFLPNKIRQTEHLVNLNEAIAKIHFPQNQNNLVDARERLAFDELFLISLNMFLTKKELQKEKAYKIKIDSELLKTFVSKLPFKLTNAQRKVSWQILKDINRSVPMNRLVEGDVGSGKTVVAAMAALSVAKAGLRTVWMAPTQVLANQHYENLSKMLLPHKIKIGLITASKNINPGVPVIVGTHSLLQKDVKFSKLALIIVDEQHRFGVVQRAHLRRDTEKIPHFLSMTATPIPRTLSLALYGSLDVSIIDELPPGRKKIITKVIGPSEREKAYQFIAREIEGGRQAFVICPLIENSAGESTLFILEETKAVTSEYKKLSEKIFPKFKVGYLHGKMKAKEKDKIMADFKNKKIDILVSTAVIEVGIDIPNASVMMIEGSEKFGLSQLHQFRGRVGRAEHQSYCLLFSQKWSDNIGKRLSAMINCQDGFELAQKDLEIRGPGELSGIRQSGFPDLKMASLTDLKMVARAREASSKIVEEVDKYPALRQKLDKFFIEKHLE